MRLLGFIASLSSCAVHAAGAGFGLPSLRACIVSAVSSAESQLGDQCGSCTLTPKLTEKSTHIFRSPKKPAGGTSFSRH